MSQATSRKKQQHQTKTMLPSLSYKQIISLVILLLVTSPSTQTPSSSSSQSYLCPTDCECKLEDFSAKCKNLDTLIASYSRKHLSRRLMPIKSLDLSDNGLTKIPNQLELLANLTELNLSHNKLSQVRKLNLQHLEKLDLSYNHITSGKLYKLPKNIVSLNLTHNDITYLPVDFMKLKKLRTLELFENPLNCTCETLHVRNWMSYQNVWSSKVIICSAPQIVKGQPWLQARQNEICFESTTTMRSMGEKWDDFDGNDVMMGDEPQSNDYDYGDTKDENIFDSKEAKHEEKSEVVVDGDEPNELDKEFLPVKSESGESTSVEPEHAVEPSPADEDDEASGEGPQPMVMEVKEQEDEDDGSGSGGGAIPSILSTSEHPSSENPTEEDYDETTTPIIVIPDTQRIAVDAEISTVESVSFDKQNESLKKASTEDNTGTYILLVIIGILLISLIIFVAMKNRQEKRQARRRYDVEKNGATELQDMDKRLLGKPIEKNGNGKHEHSPLINGDDRPQEFTTFKAPEITVDEPVQELPLKENGKSQQSLYDTPNGNGGIHEPIEPVHSNGSVPRLPDSDDEIFHPASDTPLDPESLNVSPEPPKRYSPVYPPISPRSARYSPVYSPETGRVKIKLTETPKPKTPVVVTRSRSRAGDYVNTPNN